MSSLTARQFRRSFDFCKVVIPASRIASHRDFICPKARGSHRSEHDLDDAQHDGDALDWAFGALGLQDRAKHIATLYLNDLADVIRDAIDPRFEFVRYAESLAASQPTFDQLQTALSAPHNLVDAFLHALTLEALAHHQPTLVLVTAPFPGNVYGAFRIAQAIKLAHPATVTVLGGGYCNTELRALNEPRVFDYFDFVTLDAGERPLLALIEHLQDKRPLEIGWCAPTPASITSTSKSPISLFPKAARLPMRACHCRITCRSSTCSIPCIVSGRTAAGTS